MATCTSSDESTKNNIGLNVGNKEGGEDYNCESNVKQFSNVNGVSNNNKDKKEHQERGNK